jgi:hypothetical protein
MSGLDIWAQRRKDVREEHIRFQPVILVVRDGRFECSCGALATFVNVKLDEDGKVCAFCASCHDCYCSEEKQGE